MCHMSHVRLFVRVRAIAECQFAVEVVCCVVLCIVIVLVLSVFFIFMVMVMVMVMV